MIQMLKMGPLQYMKSVWNVLQMCITALGLGSIFVYVNREIETRTILGDINPQSQGQAGVKVRQGSRSGRGQGQAGVKVRQGSRFSGLGSENWQKSQYFILNFSFFPAAISVSFSKQQENHNYCKINFSCNTLFLRLTKMFS